MIWNDMIRHPEHVLIFSASKNDRTSVESSHDQSLQFKDVGALQIVQMHLILCGLHQCLLLRRRLLDLWRDRRLPPWVLHVVPPNREAIERFRDLDLVCRERFRPPLIENIVSI